MKTYSHNPTKSTTRWQNCERAFGLFGEGQRCLDPVAMDCGGWRPWALLPFTQAASRPHLSTPRLPDTAEHTKSPCWRGVGWRPNGHMFNRLMDSISETVPMRLSVQNRSNACACWRAGFGGVVRRGKQTRSDMRPVTAPGHDECQKIVRERGWPPVMLRYWLAGLAPGHYTAKSCGNTLLPMPAKSRAVLRLHSGRI